LSGAIIPKHHEAVYESLERGEALGGGEAEHPKDDVIIVPFPGVWFQGTRLGAKKHFVAGPSGIS